MIYTMMHGKLHRATITEANLNYMGSITIDADLLDAAGILPGERVQICNNNNGAALKLIPLRENAAAVLFALMVQPPVTPDRRHCHHHRLYPNGRKRSPLLYAQGRHARRRKSAAKKPRDGKRTGGGRLMLDKLIRWSTRYMAVGVMIAGF